MLPEDVRGWSKRYLTLGKIQSPPRQHNAEDQPSTRGQRNTLVARKFHRNTLLTAVNDEDEGEVC